jgi:2,3-bisphosphoglycerate-dependent phosphoglycerate mutase
VTSGRGRADGGQTAAGLADEAIAAATGWGDPGTELILVRHGRPATRGLSGREAARDPQLSRLGERQAAAVRRVLGAGPVQGIYASTLARAHGTAQIIGAGLGLPVIARDDLREVELLGPAGVADRAPDEGLRRAAAGFARCGRWDCWPASEPVRAFRQRVRRAVAELTQRHPGPAIVIVCHSGVINACVADALDLRRDYFFRPMHASLTRLRRTEQRLILCSLNETGHLPGSLLSA